MRNDHLDHLVPTARRVLVTGGAGFIGSSLSEALVERGDEVVVLDDLSTGRRENLAALADHSRLRLEIGSVTDPAAVERAMEGCEVVFHLAAAVGVQLIVSDPIRVIETNMLGSQTLLTAAARQRAQVLFASTSEIYGKNEQGRFSEDDDRVLGSTTRSRWSYSSSKALGEHLALAYHRKRDLPVVVVRLFNTIGPRQSGRYGMVVPRFVDQALAGEALTVYGDGSQRRCFCDVDDVVRALLGLADEPAAVGGVFNIGGADEVTITELARRVLDAAGDRDGAADPTRRLRFVPYDQAYEVGFEDMRRRVADTSRLQRLTGWSPAISLAESLRRIVFERRAALRPTSA